jgi:hypothetical protein
MKLFGKSKVQDYKLQDIMYLLQNDLIDILKERNDFKNNNETEKVIKLFLDKKHTLNQTQINDFHYVLFNVMNNIKSTQGEITKHLVFLSNFSSTILYNKKYQTIMTEYITNENKTSIKDDIQSDIRVLENSINEKKSLKENEETKLKAINEYIKKNLDRIKSKPYEAESIKIEIQGLNNSLEKVNSNLTLLYSQLNSKKTELEIKTRSEDMKLWSKAGETETDELIKIKVAIDIEEEKLKIQNESINLINENNRPNIKTNPTESINFLEEFTKTYEEENTVDTNDQTKKEESFQDFLKKLQ